MKSNKVLTTILLLAVLGIWGYVGFRFFKSTGSQTVVADGDAGPGLERSVSADVFRGKELKLDYRDPFIREYPAKLMHVSTGKEPVKPKKKEPEKKEEVITYQWPEVKYKGLLVNQDNDSKRLAIVLVDGKETIVREGEKISDLVVASFDKSKVELKHDNESRVFLK